MTRRNVAVDGGEIDLVATDRGTSLVVEVRTSKRGDDPIDAVGPEKRRRVKRLAAAFGVSRVDLIGIRVTDAGVDVHWVQI